MTSMKETIKINEGPTGQSLLSSEEKKKLIQVLRDQLRDNMFGDGLEDEYIMDGISFPGLNNMSDEELLDELGHYDPDVSKTPEEKADAWRRELAGEDDEELGDL